jgi:hypothetical protein
MNLDLSAEEKLALVDLLRHTVEVDRYPLSPRILNLKAILTKIEPQPTVAASPFPAAKPGDRPRAALLARKRRRG